MQHAMSHELSTEIVIAASPDKVWSILSDFSSYPEWNPFVVYIQGRLEKHAKLDVKLRPPGGPAMKLRPQVTTLLPGKQLAWTGRVLVPGMFDGEHRFEVWPLGSERTLLIHAERFRGLLVPILKNTLEGGTRAGFEAMNEAIKERAEAA